MTSTDMFGAAELLKKEGPDLLRAFIRGRRGAVGADLRLEVMFSRSSSATDGEARSAHEGESAGFSVSVRVDEPSGASGTGQTGVEVGRLALRPARLLAAIRAGLAEAYERARLSAREKAALIRALNKYSGPARSLASVPPGPRAAVRDEVAAVYQRDPRTLDPGELRRLCRDASARVAALGPEIAFNAVAALSEVREELFIGSDGTLISQGFAFSQGDCYIVAQNGDGHQEIYDTIGQQRGLECLAEGWRGELMPNPDLLTFALELAGEARELAAAPALKPPDAEVTVVTDPHFNALISHEIIGHPSEADRALKMEAAYAGRSWFLRSLEDNEVGRQVGSPLMSACSDPSLDGYGHYLYDHEGTRARRVTHVDKGVFQGFLNSRDTAAVLGVEPNGSARASEVFYVPLIRMSNTFLMPGESDPQQIIADVEHGYYVCGSAVPSIAESRENFRISARRVYEIDHGRVGRLYRAGSVIADSKDFFMHVDAVGYDLRLIAIPNCGKGQPMQVKRMSNGGPTMRSRARLGGG
ncbi:MAG TPA: TldD/PmbA family protein [Candidatus Binataceae bacterium]|nr:TldD/PmbA family protein [Candidatus Binataceae bacterium]